MATERMRLEAEMKDSASPAIKKLRAELATLQDTTRETRAIAKLNSELERTRKESGGVHVSPGMRELPKWLTSSTEAMGGFVAKGTNASAVINGLGIGGLTAAASLAGVVAQMKAIGERSLAMKELGRETGMTVDQVNAFAHAGQHFGVGADVMNGALNHLSGQMPEFKRGYGELFKELSRWPDLIARLKKDTTQDQIKDIFDFLGSSKLQGEPQLQKQIIGTIFGNGDEMEKLFAQGSKGFLDELAKQSKQLGSISPEMLKQAQDFRDAQIKFNDTLEKFETTIGPAFLGGMTSIVSSITSAFDLLGMLNDKLHGRQSKLENDKAGEENKKNFQLRPGNPYSDGKLRLLPQSYRGGGGMLHLASFGGDDGGSSVGGGMVDTLAAGTKQGFLAAFRELMATGDTAGAGGGGLINASYGGSSPGGIGAGTGGRSVGGGGGGIGPGTAVDKTLPKEARALLDAISAGEAPDYNVLNGGGRFSDMSHHPGGRAAGRYQDLPSTWRRISGALGLKDFSPESQDKGNWWLAQQDYRSRTHRDLLGDLRSGNPGVIANIGRALHSTWVSTNGSFAGRYAGALGRGDGALPNLAGGYSAPGHIAGQLKIGDSSYRFGSGGVRGSASIPFGDHEITPNSIGPWGRSVGALGLDNEKMWDKTLGRMRTGIEMHLGHSANLITEGCVAFEKSQWPKVKAQVLDMIKRDGHAYLHVGPHGASITSRRATGLTDPAVASGGHGGSRHHLDIQLHDRGGSVMSTSLRSHGHGMSVDHRLTRWPTREQVTST